MAGKRNIKGITIEIGGDTTKLDKALRDVDTSTKKTVSNLKDVEKLLKLDPKNVDLLAQKQQFLAQNVEQTAKRYEILKNAVESYAGEIGKSISLDSYQALQRELVETKHKFEEAQAAAANFDQDAGGLSELSEGAGGLNELSEGLDTAGTSYGNFGSLVQSVAIGSLFAAGIATAIGAIKDLISWIANLDESTEEFRAAMGKLNTAYDSAGFSAGAAKESYTELYKILGNTDTATEAAQLMASLATSEEDLKKWTDIAAGAYGTFGDALPINSLMEAANETAKTGKVVGVLADALNWAGKNEEDFNDSLSMIPNTADRATYIMNQLGTTYKDAADTFYDTNQTLIETRENQVRLDDALAEVGDSVANAKNAFMSELTPALEDAAGHMKEFIDSVDWAEFGKQLSDFMSNVDFEGIFETLKNLIDIIGSIAGIVGWVWEKISPIVGFALDAIGAIIDGLAFLLELLDKFLNGSKSIRSGGRGDGFAERSGSGFEAKGFASGGVFEPNSPILGVFGDNKTEREVAAPESMLRGLMREELAGMGGRSVTTVNVRFTGSLSQLGRVLQPVITTETARQGQNLAPTR